MPSKTRKQQKFMYAEQGRIAKGQKTKSGMTADEIRHYLRLEKSTKRGKSSRQR
jgi:hypothetical protein